MQYSPFFSSTFCVRLPVSSIHYPADDLRARINIYFISQLSSSPLVHPEHIPSS